MHTPILRVRHISVFAPGSCKLIFISPKKEHFSGNNYVRCCGDMEPQTVRRLKGSGLLTRELLTTENSAFFLSKSKIKHCSAPECTATTVPSNLSGGLQWSEMQRGSFLTVAAGVISMGPQFVPCTLSQSKPDFLSLCSRAKNWLVSIHY